MARFAFPDRRYLYLIAVGVGVMGGAIVLAPFAPSLPHALLAGAIIFVGTWPLVFEPVIGASGAHKVFVCAGLSAAAFYGLPVFLVSAWAERGQSLQFYNLTFADTAALFPLSILFLALAGLLAFVLSCFACRRGLARTRWRLRISEPSTGGGLVVLLWGLFAVNFAYHLFPVLHRVPSFGQLALLLGPFSFGCFLTLALRRDIGRRHVIAFALLQTVIFVNMFASTFLVPMLIYGIVAFLVLWRVRGRFPKYLLLVSVAAAFITYNAAYTARGYIWQDGEQAEASSISKALIIGGFILRDLTGLEVGPVKTDPGLAQKQEQDRRYPLQRIVQRVSHLAHLSVAMATAPDKVPHWHGASYRPLLTSYIPRILWPGKPTEKIGGVFARQFWQETLNESMSMNLPWMPELYINFGILGVVLGMAVFGAILAVLDKLLNSAEASDVEAVLGLTVMLPFVFPDSNFSVMMGSAVPLIAFLWLYFKLGARVLQLPWLQGRGNR